MHISKTIALATLTAVLALPVSAKDEDKAAICAEAEERYVELFGEASAAVFEETRAHSPLAAKIHDQFTAALKEVGGWQKIAEVAFSVQRNRVLGI